MTKKWKDCFLDVGKCARVLRLMKFCMLLMMGVFMARGSVHAQDLMLNVKNATLKEVFKEIEEKSEYRFLFKSEDVLGVNGNYVFGINV